MGPGSAATLPQDQLRPYPCQGSAATLPTRILWKGQRFLPLSRVSCDPTWLQCKESYRFSHCFEVIQVQVQHSFYQFFPPPWQPMLCDPTWQHSFYQIFLPLPTHAFNDSSSSTTFLLSNFSPPLGNPCFVTLPDNIPFIKFFPPLGNPCFQWFKFKYNIPFIKNFSPPRANHALRPYLTTFLFIKFPHLGNPSSTTFLLSNFPPPLGNPCFATLPDNIPFIKFPPPLATHAFNDSSSSTTFLLSNFPPPLGNPCFATLPDNIPFINFSPLGNPCFQWFKFKYNIPFIQFPPPLGNPCFATLPDNIPFIKFSPPCQPMLSMIQVQVQHSFYQICPPPLGSPCFATLPDNIPFINFSPPCQPMLSMIQVQVQHSFYQFFPPLGNPCFATLPDNIPFIDPTQLLFPINNSDHR